MILTQEKNIKLIMHFLTSLSFLFLFSLVSQFFIYLWFSILYVNHKTFEKISLKLFLPTIHLDNYSNLESFYNKNLNAILV